MNTKILFAYLIATLTITGIHAQDNAIPIEAENADVVGDDFDVITEGDVTFVTPSTDFANDTNPGTADKVLSFEITFEAPGTYELYTKVRVGPNGPDDDSFYFGSAFGTRTVDADADWIRVNNIGNGAANPDDYVLSPEENIVGNEIFKWINASQVGEGDEGGTLFVVEEGSLTQTFQIGSREDGLDIDMIAFGNADLFYTVANLENGEAGVTEVPDPEKTDPIALGQDKFLGSAWGPGAFNFDWYWNQITPGNAGKWGSVEGTRDQMNWTQMDQVYDLGLENDMYIKHHVLVWGSQQPDWIETLSTEEQLAEITEWFTAVAERYPGLDAVEVVNEPLHQPPSGDFEGNYIEALGGDGATGWDWIITSFEMARDIFPDSVKLMINDYGILSSGSATNDYLEIIELLQDRGLLDLIGVQGHAFNLNDLSPLTVDANLNKLGNTGLPVFVTELDLDGFDDYQQLMRYQRTFPALWENEHVEGITLWGYAASDHWRADQGAYLINPDGSVRPSLIWLRAYVEDTFTEITDITITSAGNATTIDIPNGTLQLSAGLTPENPTLTNIEWSSSNPSIASVDESGLVTATANGEVTITARALDGSEVTGTFEVTVTNQVTGLESEGELVVYPNPADRGNFQIIGLEGVKRIRISDLKGINMMDVDVADMTQADIKVNANPGVYFIRFFDEDSIVVKKLIIK